MDADNKIFSNKRLGLIDFIFGGLLLLFCFFAFFHRDIYVTGWHALNYLFGHPLDFYENCKKMQLSGVLLDETNYPPSIFLIFAFWLYPLKLLGWLHTPFYFSQYLVYWLKILTTLFYIASGYIFFCITQCYQQDKNWGKYAAWVWLTSPIALFSQFIFSQYDIFYVFFTLIGFLFFLKYRLNSAATFFGIAFTFKYFPIFVFFPLLLLYEKKLLAILKLSLIFFLPIIIIQIFYAHSPTYIEQVLNFSLIGRVFIPYLDLGFFKIYYIFACFLLLTAMSYCSTWKGANNHIVAYIFLVGSVFPFLFIFSHPQWFLFITPSIALTTLLLTEKALISKFLLFDLIGMFFFVAYTVFVFQNNVDLYLLQTKLFHLAYANIFNMSDLFKIFKGFSNDVYFTLFWTYLLIQLILKYKLIENIAISSSYNYAKVRQRFYLGLLIFLIPAFIVWFINYNNANRYLINEVKERHFGELTNGRQFEQTFIGKDCVLNQIDLLLRTFRNKPNRKHFTVSLFDNDHHLLFSTTRHIYEIADNNWAHFKVGKLLLKKNNTYIIRLTSSDAYRGEGISWWASNKQYYKNGVARVDGLLQDTSFAFRLKFSRDS